MLFDEVVPGHVEYVDNPDEHEYFEQFLEGAIGGELTDYSREELLAVNLVFVGRRPDTAPDE